MFVHSFEIYLSTGRETEQCAGHRVFDQIVSQKCSGKSIKVLESNPVMAEDA